LTIFGLGGQVDLGDVPGDQLGAEALGLGAHVVHELRALHALGEAGEVLDLGRVISAPPNCEPSNTSGCRFARAA
jgi:hypothetical protein